VVGPVRQIFTGHIPVGKKTNTCNLCDRLITPGISALFVSQLAEGQQTKLLKETTADNNRRETVEKKSREQLHEQQ
jgi:hypothetical protein